MITKETIIDKTEILEDGTIQIREKVRFFEDDVCISEGNTNRRVLDPGCDVSEECTDIKAIVTLVHTQKKVDDFNAKKAKEKKDRDALNQKE